MKSMKEMYPDAVKDLPPNSLPPLDNPVENKSFVDIDHAGEKVTQISQTDILLYLNSAPVIWYYKRQNIVESSIFDYVFIALRLAS